MKPSEILKAVKAAQIPAAHIDHHASDLYLKVTPETTRIINQLDNKSLLTTFTDNSMINGKPSEFMNDFIKMLSAQNKVKRYKTGKLTPAEQKRIEEKTKEIFPDEVLEKIASEAADALFKAITEDFDI